MVGIDLQKISKVPKKKNKKEKKLVTGFLNKEIVLFKKSIGDTEKVRFYRQLSLLLEAGMDIQSSIEVCGKESKNKKLKSALNQISDSLILGAGLSDAIKMTKLFSEYEFYSLRIGEETGRLKEVLKQLSRYFKNRIKQRRLLINALSYPALVLTFSVGVVVFMLNFIVPIFSEVFMRFGNDLPQVTQWVIGLSDWVGRSFFPFLVVFTLFSFAAYSQKKKKWYQKMISTILMRLPLFGQLIKKIYVVQLCEALSLMLSAKVPLLSAVEMIQKMIRFYPINTAMKQAQTDLFNGDSLSESWSKNSRFFNSEQLALLRVGESSNQMPLIFREMAAQYQEEIEHETTIVGKVLEPLLIIFIGVIVGGILIAMYLPMLQLSKIL